MADSRGTASGLDLGAARIWLLIAVALLLVLGFVMVYSVTSVSQADGSGFPFEDVVKQIAYAVAGVALMVLIWRAVPSREMIGRLMWGYYIVCMVLLVLTFAMGTEVYGAKRWLYIGPFGFQPSEFVKIALLLMAIRIMYDDYVGAIERRAAITQFCIFVLLPLAFMYFTQSDLGSVIICVVGIYAAFWLYGARKSTLLVIFLVGVAAVLVAIFGVGYRSSRLIYLDPWNDGDNGLGAGYNIIHAYYAIAEGGLFGMGIGSSHEKFDYLFAADSDFIFAVIAEELGLVGALIVIGLFIAILVCGLAIASSSDDRLCTMIAGAFVIMLVFQAFLNIGCTIGVFPTTGKPLPFISSGGSSVISSLMIIGILLSVSREGVKRDDSRKRRDRIRVVSTGRSRGRRGSRG